MLPLSVSTEITMHALMKQASHYFSSGRYKQSYELYIEALLSAVKEFKRLEFLDQYVKDNDLCNLFSLAETCIKQAKQIAALEQPKSNLNTNSSPSSSSPPPIPPKPTHLTEKKTPPQLPARPIQKKLHSFPQTASKASGYHHSGMHSSSEDEDEEDDLNLIEEEGEVVRVKQKPTNDRRSSKFFIHRHKSTRRSSTVNISTSAPPSPVHSAVSNPFNIVKSFLSLPGSMTAHASVPEHGMSSTSKRGASFSSISSYLENTPLHQLDTEEVFLLTNSTVDPSQLDHAQCNSGDSLSNNKSGSTYLPMIPKAPLVVVYQSLQQKLKHMAEQKQEDSVDSMKSLLSKVQSIHISATTVPTILQFQPVLIAYQLTLIDSAIFRNIPLDAILSHGPKAPHPAIIASTDFFNYLTRLIEHSILTEQEACRRAQQINHWIKVADRCHTLKNYQTLKAIISALGTPPIERLKRSWAFIPKKSMSQLEELSDLMSETSNYGKYREKIGFAVSSMDDDMKSAEDGLPHAFSEPTVPFLGIFIHDITYLIAAISKKKTQVCHDALKQDVRVAELLRLFRELQRCPPYSPNLTHACMKELHKNKKRKLSQALSRSSPMKKGNFYPSFDENQFSIEMQQCLVTQYLLTRSWVSEKTVDELSLVREPTKAMRSYSATEPLSLHQGKSISCENMSSTLAPPILTTSFSLTTTTTAISEITRSSSGSLTSGGSVSSSNSRPESLEEVVDKESEPSSEKKAPTGSFWLFGRKSVDHGHLKSEPSTIQRSPRHFSFDDLNDKKQSSLKLPSNSATCPSDTSTFRMHREGSHGSLSVFRKEFWKHNNQQKIAFHNPDSNVPINHLFPAPHPLDKNVSN